jgi:hypothetical protein
MKKFKNDIEIVSKHASPSEGISNALIIGIITIAIAI